MKRSMRVTFSALPFLGLLILSACSGALPQDITQKVLAREISFTGNVESILGDQWVIGGQSVTVAPDALIDSPIAIGYVVQVQGMVSNNGTVIASRIELVKWLMAFPTVMMVILAILLFFISFMARFVVKPASNLSIGTK